MKVRTLLAVGLLLAARMAAAQPSVVLSAGDPAPGGLPFSSLSDAAIDDQGAIAFLGGSTGVFRRSGSTIPHLLAAGDALPDGAVVAGVGAPVLAADGCAVFRAFLVGGGDGIFRQCDGPPAAVARQGDDAPGGGVYASFSPTVAVAGGVIAFGARLDDGTNALFSAAGTTVTLVVRAGTPSPNGGTFTALHLVGVSASGRVGFRGQVAAGNDGLFSFDGSLLAPVVVLGEASPAGGAFTAIGGASLNDGDTWVFRASLSTTTNGTGIFRADVGAGQPQVTLVAREGDPVPPPVGGKAGTFRAFPTSVTPAISSRGVVAFRGTVANGLSGSGIFVVQPGAAPVAIIAAGESSGLARFRDLAIATDDSILLAATPVGGSPGLFVLQNGVVTPVGGVEDATDRGAGFRFSAPSVRATAQTGIFLGQREGIFVARGVGIVQTIAMLGDAAAGGGRYAALDPPSAGADGRVAFHADVAHNPHAPEGIFMTTAAGLRRIARSQGGAPGGGDFFGFLTGAIDGVVRADVGRGGVGFQAILERTQASTGLFVWNRSIRKVARARQTAPGGGRYVGFGTPAVGGSGQVAFVATLSGTVGNAGLVLRGGGRTRFLARTGDTTDTRAGGRFQSFDACDVGSAGVAFHAAVSSAVRQGLFLAQGKQRGALVLVGDAAPGGGSFASLASPALAGPALAFLGQVADQAAANGLYRVSAATVPGPQDPALPVEPLLVPGSPLPGAGTVVDVGPPTANDTGQIAATVDLVAGTTPTALVTIPPTAAQ